MPKLLGEERPPLLYPTPLALTPSWDLFHETTARLLFMVVRWVRGLAPYQTLSARDQVGISALPDTLCQRPGGYIRPTRHSLSETRWVYPPYQTLSVREQGRYILGKKT